MFNQSISKFSFSKLSVAVSLAVLGITIFTSAEASLVLPNKGGERFEVSASPTEVFQIPNLIGTNNAAENKGYALAVNGKAEIVGESLTLVSDKDHPATVTGTVLGLYILKDGDATLATEGTKISLDLEQSGARGISVAGKLTNNSPLDISLSASRNDLGIKEFTGVAVTPIGTALLNGGNVDIALKLSEAIKLSNDSVIAGISNAGVLELNNANVVNLTTQINAPHAKEQGYAIYNIGEMTLDARSVNLTLNVGTSEEAANKSPAISNESTDDKTQLAAIYSSGTKGITVEGDKLQIKLSDSGENMDGGTIHGIYVKDGKATFASAVTEISGQTKDGYIYGILSQKREGDSAIVTINSDTKIELNAVNQKENSYGLVAFGGGNLTVNGNLDVTANKALAIRGNGSLIDINPQGDRVVKLHGDIDFNLYSSSNDVSNSVIKVVLAGPESIWEGHTTITAKKATVENATDVAKDYKEDGLELIVTLRDNAKWVPDASNDTVGVKEAPLHTEVLPLKTLVLDNGVIELTDKSGAEVKVTTLKGTGGEVHAQVAIDENSNITSNKLSIKKTEGTPSLAVHAKGITADDVKDSQAAMESFYANALFLDKEATANTELHIPEGEVAGKLRATVDSEDNVTVQEDPHTISSSVLSIASSNYLSFRSQINDVASRLGDLRSMPKTAGAWVRYYGGQNKYSDRGMKEDYNTIQIGGDGFIADKYYLGGTFSYTDGNGTLVNGSSDDKNYNFGIYGGWLGEKGQFVDVIVKRHRIKSDFDLFNALGKSSGSYRTWGTSASIEAGWRLQCPANGFYAEPQAEFMLGHVESVNYKTNRGVRIHQDGINSAIGRVGVAFGYTFPENKGNAYAKASVLHDWKGDVKASYSKDGVSRRMHDDLGGTWGEFAVGATYNPIKNLSAYGQFKTTTGSPIRTPWQASIGVRYSF